MSEVIYKIRVNRPCRLFIDDEEMMILDENKLTKITLPEGEYLRKVVAIDNKAIFDEAEITLSGASKLDNITLDTTGLEEAKRNALPKEQFQVGDLMYKALEDGSSVAVAKYVDKNVMEVVIPEEIVYNHYIYEVKEIEERAFWDCESLTSATIPNSVTSIGFAAFAKCSGLTSITFPNSVTSIGDLAFYECSSLTSITIPKSVMSIGEWAFKYCSGLTSITIPNSVTSIGEGAFACTRLTAVVWNAENCADCSYNSAPFYNIRSQITSFTFGDSVQHIPAYLCDGMNNLTSITIPNSVTSIGDGAFKGCSRLTSITIPNSVTSIGDATFVGCSSLTSITIPNSVTSIGNGAFGGCKSLTSFTIPNSVTSIGDIAFFGCESLTSIRVEDGNTKYDSRDNCNAIIETTTNTLIKGCQNTIIPNSVTSIGEYAFLCCFSLTSIPIPNSVTSIGDWAFRGCSALKSITIPNSVTEIGYGAFLGCDSLTSVTVPSHTEIGEDTFPEHTKIIRE